VKHYYNEFDEFPATWLSNLAAQGQLPPGRVDTRSIADVLPEELEGYTQCHFFAGIGGWPYALRLAGVPEDFPVWTGSCPCQPFSVAGRQKGVEDERHLFPVWYDLITYHIPPIVFGEQVASPSGRAWLANVRSEMEALGYAFGAADLCAAGIGAPHIRQRLFFGAVRLADSDLPRPQGRLERREGSVERASGASRLDGGLVDSDSERQPRKRLQLSERRQGRGVFETTGHGEGSGMGADELLAIPVAGMDPGATRGFWGRPDWLLCRDAKVRPVEPGTFPLAHGVSEGVGLLRGYGNAIVPQLAAEFIKAFFESIYD